MESRLSHPWPDDCQGAVSLTFDDGSSSQLGIAVPLLNDCNLHGTFYLNPGGDDWRTRLEPWREAGLRGHELGNHTMGHVCSQNLGGDEPRIGLEVLTLQDIEADVAEAARRLRELVPEQNRRSFCYPCYQSDVGRGAGRQSYIPVIARYHVAARGLGEMANHARWADLHYLSSWPIAGWMSAAELIQMATIAYTGRWVILTFHGFQNGPATGWVPGTAYHQPAVPAATFRELCTFLATERGRIWTAPVAEIAQRLVEWRETFSLQSTKGE
jgi:peptidoglycan-N-acetylglucosamine deacetylase